MLRGNYMGWGGMYASFRSRVMYQTNAIYMVPRRFRLQRSANLGTEAKLSLLTNICNDSFAIHVLLGSITLDFSGIDHCGPRKALRSPGDIITFQLNLGVPQLMKQKYCMQITQHCEG